MHPGTTSLPRRVQRFAILFLLLVNEPAVVAQSSLVARTARSTTGSSDACELITGNARAVQTTGDPSAGAGYTETLVGSLRLRQDKSYPPPSTVYVLESGWVTWSATGQIGDCSVTGVSTRVDLQPPEGQIQIGPDGVYSGGVTSSALGSAAELRLNCPDGSTEVPPSLITVFGVGPFDGFTVSEDGRRLEGSLSYPGLDQSWNLARCVSVRITAPTADEHLVPGETYTITWVADGVEVVNLDLRTRAGAVSARIADHLPAVEERYAWKVPDSLARRAQIHIEDAAVPEIEDTSEEFRIKGYVLARVRDNEYERFEPARHGWKAENSDGNWDPPTYAETGQFCYRCQPPGTDPFSQKPYPFYQFYLAEMLPPRFGDFPSFVRAFGGGPFYWADPRSPEPAAYRTSGLFFWVAKSGPDWGGSCSGMSVSALMAFSKPGAFGARFPAIGARERLFDAIPGPTVPDPVRASVNALFQYWDGTAATRHSGANRAKRPRATLENLKEMLLDPDDTHAHDAYLYIANATGSALGVKAHAVAPILMKKTSEEPTRYDLEVYDPNAPGQRSRIQIDSTADKWAYPGQYDGSGGFYLMDPVANYFPLAGFPGLAAGKNHAVDDLEIVPSPWASITIEGSEGTIGYRDGRSFSTIPDREPVVVPTGYPSYPTPYLVGPDAYRVTQAAYPEPLASLLLIDQGRYYSARRGDASPDQTDRFALGDGMRLRNDDPVTKSWSYSAVLPGETHDRVFDVTGLDLAQGDSVDLSVNAADELRIHNPGSARTYGLTVRMESASGVVSRHQESVVLGDGATHAVVPDWSNPAVPVTVHVDVDSDGTFEGSFELADSGTGMRGVPGEAVPQRFGLRSVHPNPATDRVTLGIDLPRPARIRITVTDILGRVVTRPWSETRPAGAYELALDLPDLGNGVYLIHLDAGGRVSTKSLVVLR